MNRQVAEQLWPHLKNEAVDLLDQIRAAEFRLSDVRAGREVVLKRRDKLPSGESVDRLVLDTRITLAHKDVDRAVDAKEKLLHGYNTVLRKEVAKNYELVLPNSSEKSEMGSFLKARKPTISDTLEKLGSDGVAWLE